MIINTLKQNKIAILGLIPESFITYQLFLDKTFVSSVVGGIILAWMLTKLYSVYLDYKSSSSEVLGG